jgi:hypothetical protein
MLIVISKERLQAFLEEEIQCWESVSGGPNLNAFSFDPKTTDPAELKALGYYDNREAWLAGARIKELRAYIADLQNTPQFVGK